MPLYEYECEQCGDIFEVMQKFSDEPLVTHEKCGGPVHKRLSAPALQFKGSGWYITDYAKSGKGAGNGGTGKPEKPASDSSGSSESGGTAKPASTSASTETKSTPSDTK